MPNRLLKAIAKALSVPVETSCWAAAALLKFVDADGDKSLGLSSLAASALLNLDDDNGDSRWVFRVWQRRRR